MWGFMVSTLDITSPAVATGPSLFFLRPCWSVGHSADPGRAVYRPRLLFAGVPWADKIDSGPATFEIEVPFATPRYVTLRF